MLKKKFEEIVKPSIIKIIIEINSKESRVTIYRREIEKNPVLKSFNDDKKIENKLSSVFHKVTDFSKETFLDSSFSTIEKKMMFEIVVIIIEIDNEEKAVKVYKQEEGRGVKETNIWEGINGSKDVINPEKRYTFGPKKNVSIVPFNDLSEILIQVARFMQGTFLFRGEFLLKKRNYHQKKFSRK
jgi:hypothetical protein